LCQLVQFIGDGVFPPALHVAADVPEWGHTLNLLPIGLPHRRKAISPILPTCEMLEDLLLREVHTAEISALRPRNCAAGIGIGDSTLFTAGFGNHVSMLPVVAELARLPAYDEVRRARTELLPLSP